MNEIERAFRLGYLDEMEKIAKNKSKIGFSMRWTEGDQGPRNAAKPRYRRNPGAARNLGNLLYKSLPIISHGAANHVENVQNKARINKIEDRMKDRDRRVKSVAGGAVAGAAVGLGARALYTRMKKKKEKKEKEAQRRQ